jgi:adenylate cyclase
MADMDFEGAGLLDGLSGAERDDRLALLEQLARDGFSIEELAVAVREHRLALLGVERLLGGQLTAQDLEAQTGVPAAVMLRLRRLMGLPEAGATDRVFRDEDIEAARSIKLFRDGGIPIEQLAEITRVLGEGMSRLAATVTASFADSFLQPGDSEYDVALRFTLLAEQMTPAVSPVLVAAFNSHLRESVHRGMIGAAERAAGQLSEAQEIAVCFADLVGFTRLGGELEVQDLGSVAGKLAELASGLASRPVRLVKTIGDAALFVSSDPEPMVATALALIDAAEEADLPSLRAGIAFGPAVQRAGDFFGHTVNLASRVTGAARPGSVLGTEPIRNLTADQFRWSAAGTFRLKGVAEHVPLYRARLTELEPVRKPSEDRRRRRASR